MTFTFEHIGLPAQDPQALKNWYTDVLGAKVTFSEDGGPPFLLTLPGGAMLEIYASESSSPLVTNNKLGGWRHVALRVESIEAVRSELEKRGVRFTEQVRPAAGGGRVLFFADTEGNLLHLVERTLQHQ
jgi:glyoxylase I family protein